MLKHHMSKLLIALLLTSMVLSAAVPSTYTKSAIDVSLDPEIKITDIGYSPSQSLLAVLVQTPNEFYIYNGIKKNNPQKIKITDTFHPTQQFTITCLAFNDQQDFIVVGTSLGSIYGFKINNDIVDDTYDYYYYLQTRPEDISVTSIDVSKNGMIAVAGIKLKVFVLFKPEAAGQLQFQLNLAETNIQYHSVAWSNKNPNLVLIGGSSQIQNQGRFIEVDISVKPFVIPDPINKQNTFSVAYHPSGDYLFQGTIEKDVAIFNSDATHTAATPPSIPNSKAAYQILLSTNGLQLALQLKHLQICAFSLVLQTPHLSIQQSLSLSLTQSIPLQDGSQIAITSSSNQILVIPVNKASTIQRFNLCVDGQLYDQQGCQQCNPDCKTCFGTVNYCLNCNKGDYLNGNTCATCASKTNACKTCDQLSGFCITCDDKQGWNTNAQAGVCKCDPTHYQQGNTCKLCQDDIFDCSECDDAQTCTSCKEIDNFDPKPSDKGQCQCVVGYQKVQNVCTLCNTNVPGCKECSDLDTCTKCNKDAFFVQNPNTDNKCSCMATYYLNEKNCSLCSGIITGCKQCSSATQCTTCSDPDRVPSTDGLSCVCKQKFFQDKGVCTKCDDNDQCLVCTDTTECTQCNKAEHWVPDTDPQRKLCICDRTYYKNDQNKCVPCLQTGCDKCEKPDTCESCSEEKGFKPDAVENKCSCKVGKYLKTDICDDCFAVIPGCLTCDSAQKCDTCNNDPASHFIPQPNADNQCSCQDTYFLNKDICSSCREAIIGCENCDSSKVCQSCDTTKKFVQDPDFQGQCTCVDSYYKNQTQRSCLLCSSKITYCQNCTVIDATVTCSKCQQNLIPNFDQSSCVCGQDQQIKNGRCEPNGGLSPLAIIAIIVGILAVAGGVVAVIKCCKKRKSPLEDDQYQALEENK